MYCFLLVQPRVIFRLGMLCIRGTGLVLILAVDRYLNLMAEIKTCEWSSENVNTFSIFFFIFHSWLAKYKYELQCNLS